MRTLTGNSELLPSDIIDFTMLLALRQSNQWYIAHATEANPQKSSLCGCYQNYNVLVN